MPIGRRKSIIAQDRNRTDRKLVTACVMLLGTSIIFPLWAALRGQDEVPSFVGYLDVILAFALIALAARIEIKLRGAISGDDRRVAYAVVRAAAHLILILIATFLLIGDRINWKVLIIGLAWRAWLLVQILPALAAGWRPK